MRQGSLTGLIFLYVFIGLIASIAEERNMMAVVAAGGVTPMTSLYRLLHPNWADLSVLQNYIWAIFNVLSLWFNGTLWQGQWLWVYYLLIVPTVVGVGWEVLVVVATGLASMLGFVGRTIGSFAGFGR